MNTPDTALTDTTCTPVTTTPAIQKKATRATILLAEDDRSIRRFLEIILQRAGYEVIVAADGLEAMKMVLTKTIDAVITDAVMPHLNGYELCRFLRRHAQLSHLPVILLSGLERADDGCEEKCRADAYLSKPVRPEELNACLTRLLPEIA
ncbi:MAG TPA: response regulator [Pyrinomonadaceae bacterium]|nr:response regulator [Pyrinomonadaceae bacterium]